MRARRAPRPRALAKSCCWARALAQSPKDPYLAFEPFRPLPFPTVCTDCPSRWLPGTPKTLQWSLLRWPWPEPVSQRENLQVTASWEAKGHLTGENSSQTAALGPRKPPSPSLPFQNQLFQLGSRVRFLASVDLFSTPGAWVGRAKTGKLVAHVVFCHSRTASCRGAPGTLTAETNSETRPRLNKKGTDAGVLIESGLLDRHQVEAVNSIARAAKSGALGGQ